jgi:histidinol dehydrogenase
VRRIAYGTPAWERYLSRLPRAAARSPRAERAACRIVEDVRRRGDLALVDYTRRFDGVSLRPTALRARASQVRAAARRAEPALVASLRAMARRILAFHARQRQDGFRMRLRDGSLLEEVVAPIASVGLYVPGGSGAYPSSVLMTAIPARVAGVPHIAVATPPRTLEASPALAAALVVAGIEDSVFRVGGAQAIAALAYGTASVPKVAKIVGPGNAYVAAAKRLVRDAVLTDAEAGPSEVVVLADDAADAGFVAADLLAQAEHGSGDETVALVTTSAALASEVARRVDAGLPSVANVARARRALARNGALVLVRDMGDGVRAVNAIAPEHVEVLARGAAALARRLVAGAVFVGDQAPVAVGDYGVGPNHVLPTGGAARFSSPLSVRDFQRRWSRVRMSARGLRRVAGDVVRVALAEGFKGHAQSVLARLA